MGETDDCFLIETLFQNSSGIMETVSKERNAIQVSKDFLRKQRQSLKRRQAALQAAKQELIRDMQRHKQGVCIYLIFIF